MEKPVRSSLQNLSISYECALAIGNSLNLSEMLQEVIHTVVHKTNAHRGIIWVKNGEQELQPVANAGINIEDVLAEGKIKDLRDALIKILKRQQFVLKYKDDSDFLQYCPFLTGKEESVLIVPVTNVAILYLVYAGREIADEPLANLLASLSNKLSVAIEACTAHENVIKEIQVREKAEKELTKKTEQLVSSQKELQGLYGESEQAKKSLLSILEDVTQKEEALKESESKLNSILSSIDDLVFVFDQEDRFILPQHSPEEQLYTTPVEFIGKKPSEVLPSHLNKIFSDAFDKIREGEVAEYDYWLNIDDKTLWFSGKHSPRFIDGEFMGSVSVVRDITERKTAEEELKKSTELLQSVMDNATDEAIITTDHMGIILSWNEGARRLLGYEPEEVVGRESVRIFHTKEYLKSGIMDVNAKMIATGKPLTEELDYVAKDGKTIPVQEIVSPRFDEDGKFIGMVGMVRDITERKQADEAHAAEANRRRILMEQSRDGIVVLDQDGSVYESNQRFAEMLGFSPEEVSHLHVWDWEFQFTREQVLDMIRNVDYVGDAFETQHRRKDGTIYDVEISTNGAVFAGEKLIFCVCRDITERKQAEVELQKLNNELEQRVIERTAELEENNKDLEHMVKAFTGREIRMIELKDIIKDLEKQLAARENKGE